MKSLTRNFLPFEASRIAMALAFVAAVFLMTSCGDDDDDDDGASDIVSLASETTNLSVLVEALTRFPDLVGALSDETGQFTVFAPNDDAFVALLGVIGQENLSDIPDDVLRRVLEYHVVSGVVESSDLSDGQTASTLLTGESVSVSISGSSVSINTSNVVTADVGASNGVVHIVDAVLVPSLEASIVNTVVEPAYFNNNFTTLTSAVVTAGLLETLIDPDANLTVFAPTNEAFTEAGITSLEGLTAADLEPILLYHVLGSEVVAADLPATGSAVESLGGDFYLSINNDGVFINGSSEVTTTDIDADNGVVHVINRTLVPTSDDVVAVAVAASTATENAEFGQLVAALTAVENDASAANLVTTLSGTSGSPFTVFAPTDAAFAQLYTDAGVADLDGLIGSVGISTLEAVLTYHVVGGARIFSSDLPNLTSNTVTSLGGTFTLDLATLTITETDGALSLDTDNDAAIVGTDILGTNGVIHVIDKVILP